VSLGIMSYNTITQTNKGHKMSESNKIRVVTFIDPEIHRALESMVDDCIVKTNLSNMVNSLLGSHRKVSNQIEEDGFNASHNQQLNDEM